MSDVIRTAIMKKLSEDKTLKELATGGFFFEIADPPSEPPFLVFMKSAGIHLWSFGGPPLDEDRWTVKGIGDVDTAEDIDARCREVLNRTTLTMTGRTHQFLLAESDLNYPEVKDGEWVQHVGAIYRLISEGSK